MNITTTIKHTIKVDGKIVDARYASREVAEARCLLARETGRVAEYAGPVTVTLVDGIPQRW